MADKSAIQWTDSTWNPVTGCSKVSPGCKYCYAERWTHRMQRMGVPKYSRGFQVTLHPSVLQQPLSWREPRRVFVNSMSDLFHEDVPDDFIQHVLDICRETPQHIYQILTKRASRLPVWHSVLLNLSNVWVGVSVEDQKRAAQRLDHLLQSGTSVPFVSAEPLLGPLNLNPWLQSGIAWVIVGGESGPNHRPMNPDWVIQIRDNCIEEKVPFFFKQWGGLRSKSGGRLLDGETWDELPKRVVQSKDWITTLQ